MLALPRSVDCDFGTARQELLSVHPQAYVLAQFADCFQALVCKVSQNYMSLPSGARALHGVTLVGSGSMRTLVSPHVVDAIKHMKGKSAQWESNLNIEEPNAQGGHAFEPLTFEDACDMLMGKTNAQWLALSANARRKKNPTQLQEAINRMSVELEKFVVWENQSMAMVEAASLPQ